MDQLLRPEQRELIAKLGAEMAPSTKTVHVRPMERFGFSTTKLFVVHFDERRASRPFVVKVDERKKYDQERAAVADLKVFFADADVHYCDHGDVGGIAYPLRENSTGIIETFEDALRRESPDRQRLCDRLDAVYDSCCGRAHRASNREKRLLAHEYEWYHIDIKTDAELEKALGQRYNDSQTPYYGATIVDPRAVKRRLDAVEQEILVGPIHGDLHGSNVVFDSDGAPHLIDFAWGNRSGHVMKDFVLMENSLRFFAFPRYFDADLQRRVDDALLQEDGCAAVRDMVLGTPLQSEYQLLADLVELTRQHARAAAGNDYFDEYVKAQFMILYRLLQYPSYPFHATLRALGNIGRSIYETL